MKVGTYRYGDAMDIIVPLTENYEFKRVYARGKSVVRPTVVVYCMRKNGPGPRVGITASKKIGNAVTRNRARRIIREAFRIFDHDLRSCTEKRYDFIFVARTQTASLKSGKILQLMNKKLMPLVVPGLKKNG